MTENLENYVIIDEWQLNEYYKKGYRFVAVINQAYTINNGQHTVFTGTFMNNHIELQGNVNTTNYNTRFLMELEGPAKILFGEKRDT